ncbi:hypothetical protein CALVIDRAFT_569017 [Calocera viscosa TUFC12733]|uniref:Pre-mRNA-processing protein 45 n=1 Tax=Calocera viscosa (strain TUFC12733) TaxID=1330018 RepID=A0A167GFS5_CALVF|nr:hypothetical protein CALVIDRAFT_569017 [Calocera viscosa TUFC12733]
MATALASLLPKPLYSAPVEEEEEVEVVQPTLALAPRAVIPPYGQRSGWRPLKADDFGDGGAYPECHIAQYPNEMGKKKTAAGNTLALQVDSEGNVRYDVIATQGHREGVRVQSQFKDLVPLAQRTDLSETERQMELPTDDEIAATAERTKAALEKLVNGKIKAAQPKHVPDSQGQSQFIRYTPVQQSGNGLKQRIIKMSEVVEDPLEPPRFKHKKVPRGPPSPPPPVLRSPPRKATAEEQKAWMIPPSISNWKNNKGFTIPLDKRLAADGRGLQDIHINDNFAKLSEALYVADRHAREEVRQRALMQQKLAQKEKESKEENLRLLAQRARQDRVAPSGSRAESAAAGGSGAGRAGLGLADYGSEESEEESEREEEEEEDEEAAKVRDEMRREKRQQRERELRMNNMGTEQRAKMLAREQNRDISEKIALGLAKPSVSKESMLDQRLFNRDALPSQFADEDAYNLYDRPLFHGSTAAAAIYKRGNLGAGNDESFGGGTEEGITEALENDRFGLGAPKNGFQGAGDQEVREGPVQFEKDTGDVFGVDQFLESATRGTKRGLEAEGSDSRKRRQIDRADERED